MDQLETLAAAALRNHNGDVDKALPEFLAAVTAANLTDDLAGEFLRSVRGFDQTFAEAQAAWVEAVKKSADSH